MKDTHSILEDYRNGNFEKRLFLFLECRSLRPDFVRIDHEEAKVKKETQANQSALIYHGSRKSTLYPFRRLLKWCHSFMN